VRQAAFVLSIWPAAFNAALTFLSRPHLLPALSEESVTNGASLVQSAANGVGKKVIVTAMFSFEAKESGQSV